MTQNTHTTQTTDRTDAHRWTQMQIEHMRATAHLSIYKAVRSLRHRFGARVAKLTDNAIKGKRYHVLHPEKQVAQRERRRARMVGYAGPAPAGMNYSAWLAANNID